MPQKNIDKQNALSSNSAIELLSWPYNQKFNLTEKHKKVFAFQTTRFNPQKSLAVKDSSTYHNSTYDSFNLGFHVKDNAVSVTKNRLYLQNHIQALLSKKINIQWLEQIHSNKVIEISHHNEQALIADASITRERNVALAIMTADCLPILLCDAQGTEIAAIHGGWRPLAGNIIKNTLEKMHSCTGELHAWLGPCIGNNSFEVGEEVKLAFTKQDVCFAKAFVQQTNGKYLADLSLIATLQLINEGITKVTNLAECTYNLSNKYYSYRRESTTGRMSTIICLAQ